MTFARAAAALLALWLSGCALLPGKKPDNSPTPAGTAAAGKNRILAVNVEIKAPTQLKALLEQHLDLIRLGNIGRGEVDEGEWSRLIDATPAQVRSLLQTEGYFAPQIELTRVPVIGLGEAQGVQLAIEPGPLARVSRVTIEVEGEL
ncbi:MAG: outer membrane protein assembly factor, partial [Chitinophagaceae bacterium]|nr:outer membrane protein assembly factor [Rubrivivax sp.]